MSFSSGKYWSKWVDKFWDKKCAHAINFNFNFELTDVNKNTFIICGGHFKNETWKVKYYDDRPPEYERGIFASSKVGHHISFYLNLFLNE